MPPFIPRAILIYSPVNSTRAGIDELKALLKRAGHNPVALDRHASVSAALAASPYDVVIADYLDADRLKVDLQSAASASGVAADPEHAEQGHRNRGDAAVCVSHQASRDDQV